MRLRSAWSAWWERGLSCGCAPTAITGSPPETDLRNKSERPLVGTRSRKVRPAGVEPVRVVLLSAAQVVMLRYVLATTLDGTGHLDVYLGR